MVEGVSGAMGNAGSRALVGASPRRAWQRVAAGSFALFAACLVAFCCAACGVFSRAYLVEVDPVIAPLLGGGRDALALSGDGGGAGGDGAQAGGSETAASAGGASLLSSIVLPDAGALEARRESATQEAASAGTGSGGASGSSDAGSPGAASPGASGGSSSADQAPSVSEAQEQAYLQALRANYDALAGYYQRVSSGWQDFLQTAGSSTPALREQRVSTAGDLFYETSVAHVQITDLQVPAYSRHYASYQEILTLNYDIDSAAALLNQAWWRCYLDPEDESDWMTPFNVNSVNGKITFLADFESRYPGARP